MASKYGTIFKPPVPLAGSGVYKGQSSTGRHTHHPVGIVFHTSESWMAPFEAHGNESLRRYGLGLLANARKNRLYNFVIDRFGRVYRIVAETQAGNHAGNSVWADSKFVYVNLNQSFVGISFEAQTGAALSPVNKAQIHAGQVLTPMLRSVYGIAEADCVTHAQVSVNPSKMFIGYHTDWASSFPFREIGLSEGYANPVAGVCVFGFRYDHGFLQAIGGRPWPGLVTAENQLIQEAAALGITPDAYRGTLQKRYKDTIGNRENLAAAEETQHEQSCERNAQPNAERHWPRYRRQPDRYGKARQRSVSVCDSVKCIPDTALFEDDRRRAGERENSTSGGWRGDDRLWERIGAVRKSSSCRDAASDDARDSESR